MRFADNLKRIRKEKHLSQEDLAELLGVSRQAVSKWEQATGYPEVETLLLLSQKLHISLDSLMAAEIAAGSDTSHVHVQGKIVITSPYENVIANCYKVIASQKMRGGKASPQYALFGVSDAGVSLWGETTTFLGWYADQQQIAKEVRAIQDAIGQGIGTYALQYSVRVERRWLRIRIVQD